ncbi:MAG TPA: secretin N-terminal domain-containing protein, partial [Pirellulaceae bacterium]|nr:secretin N-terminal domain-containing protein [Pirellulaceae bacterium]
MNLWRSKVTLLVLVTTLGLGLIAWRLGAQESAPAGYRTYVLRNANASDLATQVRGVLSGSVGKTDVIIDKQANALLIKASDDGQRLASQLISALDLPAQPVNKPLRGEPIVRGYRLPEGNTDRLLTDLRRRYPASSGASLSVDPRTRQLLALAPVEVHRQLEKEFGGEVQQTGAVQQPNLISPRGTDVSELVQRPYPLKNIDWQHFEDFLQRIWGNKANLETNRSGEVAAIRLRNAAGEDAVVRVDRRHNEVTFEGTRGAATNWAKLVSVLDGGPTPREQSLQLVPVHRADPEQLQDAIDLIKIAMREPARNAGQAAQVVPFGERAQRKPGGGELMARIFQQPEAPAAQPERPEAPEQPAPRPMGEAPAAPADPEGGPIGPVQIEFIEGLDVIVVRGKKEDVEKVTKIIRDIEAQSQTTQPVIELYMLRNVDSVAVGDLVIQLYNQVLSARAGRVSITPLGKPNALLLIGTRDSIETVLELVKKLDTPVQPSTQFKVFQLKHMAAADANLLLTDFYA